MLNKTMIAITAAVIVGSASAALSYDDPESKIGDRYPLLDQSSRSYAVRNIGGPYMPARGLARLDQPMPEDVESRIGDRYPGLEQTTPPFSAARVLQSRVAMRQTAAIVYYDDPESRISDRYPLLDRVSPQRRSGVATARLRQSSPRG